MSKADPNAPRVSLNCAVLTISDSRTAENDTSGDYLGESIGAAGHRCVRRALSSGNMYELRKIVSDWIADGEVQVVITNGGTGFTHQKSTGAAITPLLDMTLAGFGELFRHLSYLEIGSSSLQSDAFAGVANDTLIFCVPGSTNACKTAWEGIIKEQLDSTHRPCNFATHYLNAADTLSL
ncbi:molybdenum cofactor biosynthesis protein B [Pusillimonas caeni]|uniref:molybdenum cofactor biosynthesis protein B n=1 Tax=Pusillimonas caeni TaxID=1348472 RepID=UPI000E599C8A|nr:molybdenum cofactor biosynthesis protein B [Pusillimonas caeni]TFL13273.1 molybdenum cofactor biosynthesis protein B [Pusillimonas caeni]